MVKDSNGNFLRFFRTVVEFVPLTAEQESSFEGIAEEALGLNEVKNEN